MRISTYVIGVMSAAGLGLLCAGRERPALLVLRGAAWIEEYSRRHPR